MRTPTVPVGTGQTDSESRFLLKTLAPIFVRKVLDTAGWSSIMSRSTIDTADFF